MQRIYLDHAATSPLRPEARAAMLAVLDGARNPSSIHAEGRAARAVLDDARSTVARVLGAAPREIVFTGSGTEAAALAIAGAAAAARGRHLVVSAVEHVAVLAAADALAAAGWEVTRAAVSRDGVVAPATVGTALREDTALVSVMLANNETGTLQPVAAVAALARARGALVHTDAVQAAGTSDVTPSALGVDLLSLSAHKVGGPPGVGVLYVRAGTQLAPVVAGGPQEHGLRAGTENLAGIAGAAAAFAAAAAERTSEAARLAALRERLEGALVAGVAEARITGRNVPRVPHVTHVAFADVPNDALLIALDLEGVSASAGSACAAGSLEPSHVVAALGLPDRFARGVVRFSLGRTTTRDEVDRAAAAIAATVVRVRAAGPV